MNWYKVIKVCLLLFLVFVLGSGAGLLVKANRSLTLGENWGLGFSKEKNQPPSGRQSSEELKKQDAYYIGDTKKKDIYLTFDAGFENGNTEPILEALKKHKVKATFFIVGNYIETQPELVKRMVEEGHTVGNHSYHHYDLTTKDKDVFTKELKDLEALYEEKVGGKMSCFYRPPQGKYNQANLEWARELGYKTVFWSLAYVDWNKDSQPTKEEAFDKLLNRIHPGAIVLLHSTSQTNGEILDELLTKWEEMGYQVKPLSELPQ